MSDDIDTQTDAEEKLTEDKAVERFVNLFLEVETLNQDVKELAEEAKEAELDVKTIKAAAKLIAKAKYADFRDKTSKVVELLDRVGK